MSELTLSLTLALTLALTLTPTLRQADVLEVGGLIQEWTYFASLSSRTIIYKGMVMSCVPGG